MILTNTTTTTNIFPWFKNWFDSTYYHKLYSNRDEKEAALFINHLAALLPASGCVIDVGCGTGRHSKHLAEKGFTVTGIDLSSYSLQLARHYKHINLHFERHDMRRPFGTNRFDAVLNLFTSFGYFETVNENLQVLKNMYDTLKPGGTFVIDYLNRHYTEQYLVYKEQKEIDGILYNINRWTDEQFFYKNIEIKHSTLPEPLAYTEKVSKFGLKDFESMIAQCRLEITDVYGDYQLNAFDEQQSKRLIITGTKR